MTHRRSNPLSIPELWLALIIPVATVIGLLSLLHVASNSGFTPIVEPPAARAP